jgi:predicted regulator of amino acid metabolism with ACT domain
MWDEIRKTFSENPKKLRVIQALLEFGYCIKEDGKIYSSYADIFIEIPYSKIAEALQVDRRVVINTVKSLLEKESLKQIFTGIKVAGPSFRDIAKHLGCGVVEIHANSHEVGVIAGVTELIKNENISIRQILADDPELYPEPKLTIITEKPVTNITEKFLKVKGIKSVSIY